MAVMGSPEGLECAPLTGSKTTVASVKTSPLLFVTVPVNRICVFCACNTFVANAIIKSIAEKYKPLLFIAAVRKMMFAKKLFYNISLSLIPVC